MKKLTLILVLFLSLSVCQPALADYGKDAQLWDGKTSEYQGKRSILGKVILLQKKDKLVAFTLFTKCGIISNKKPLDLPFTHWKVRNKNWTISGYKDLNGKVKGSLNIHKNKCKREIQWSAEKVSLSVKSYN